jgi:hypothetical protein
VAEGFSAAAVFGEPLGVVGAARVASAESVLAAEQVGVPVLEVIEVSVLIPALRRHRLRMPGIWKMAKDAYVRKLYSDRET